MRVPAFLVCVCLLAFVCAPPAYTEAQAEAHTETRGGPDPLARLAALTAAVTTLRCSFTQTTAIPLFSEPIRSHGRLLFQKPDSLLWEYSDPAPQGLAFSGGQGFRWEEDKDKRTPFSLAEDPATGLIAVQMLAWVRFDREWIEANYALEVENAEPLALILTPKNEAMRGALNSLTIRFADDGIARSLVLQEASGGSTEIRFHDVVLNGPAEAGEFL